MKVLLTGASGSVGGAALNALLEDPSIKAVFAVARRPLPVSHGKLEVLIVDDLGNWPQQVLKEVADVDACFWYVSCVVHNSKGSDHQHRALGNIASKDSIEKKRVVACDFPLAFLTALLPVRAASSAPFRFIYLSGHFTEPRQDASLWLVADQRKLGVSATLWWQMTRDLNTDNRDTLRMSYRRSKLSTAPNSSSIFAGRLLWYTAPASFYTSSLGGSTQSSWRQQSLGCLCTGPRLEILPTATCGAKDSSSRASYKSLGARVGNYLAGCKNDAHRRLYGPGTASRCVGSECT